MSYVCSYVNNLAILAACTQLGRALMAENGFIGPTFVKLPLAGVDASCTER